MHLVFFFGNRVGGRKSGLTSVCVCVLGHGARNSRFCSMGGRTRGCSDGGYERDFFFVLICFFLDDTARGGGGGGWGVRNEGYGNGGFGERQQEYKDSVDYRENL